MLLRMSEQIAECLLRAEEARRRAAAATNPEIQEMYCDIERRLMLLANSFRFVEQADRFLSDAQRNRLETVQPVQPKVDHSHLAVIHCEKCSGNAHLIDCAPCTKTLGEREIWTFKCELCGEEAKRIVEK